MRLEAPRPQRNCYFDGQMLNPSHPSEVRRFFREAWCRRQDGLPLTPLQSLLVDVLAWHPEYQSVWGNAEAEASTDAEVAEVFLHLSLHVALREAVSTDRPKGIDGLARSLAARLGDLHRAEHAMMECLRTHLDQLGRGRGAGEQELLESLRRL